MPSVSVTTCVDLSPASPAHSPALLGVRLTFAGLLYAAVVVLIGLAALINDLNLLFLLFGVGVGVLCFNLLAAPWAVRLTEAERLLPEAVVAGLPFKLVYILRTRRRWSRCWSLIVSECPAWPGRRAALPWRSAEARRLPPLPEGFVDCLAPGDERRIELMTTCRERGRLGLRGIRVTSRFPLGLASCTIDFPAAAELVVYPALGRFRRDPWKERYAGAASMRRRAEPGTDEFYGVREYRQGDNLRWVHWRRSARTGQLVVREMLPLNPAQLIVLLDPWPEAPPASRGQPRRAPDPAERIISAAATALCEGIERGHRVGLVCRAAVPVVIPPAAGQQQRRRLMHELALVSGPGSEALDEIIARLRWSSGWHARCLLCAPRLDAMHDQVVKLIGARAEAIMLLTADSDVFEPASGAPGGLAG